MTRVVVAYVQWRELKLDAIFLHLPGSMRCCEKDSDSRMRKSASQRRRILCEQGPESLQHSPNVSRTREMRGAVASVPSHDALVEHGSTAYTGDGQRGGGCSLQKGGSSKSRASHRPWTISSAS